MMEFQNQVTTMLHQSRAGGPFSCWTRFHWDGPPWRSQARTVFIRKFMKLYCHAHDVSLSRGGSRSLKQRALQLYAHVKWLNYIQYMT